MQSEQARMPPTLQPARAAGLQGSWWQRPAPINHQFYASHYEIKYLLNRALVAVFEPLIQQFMQADVIAAPLPGQRYFVRSLYFDDGHYSAYFDKVDGVNVRYKYRVRTYTDTPGADAAQFLEIKGRHKQLVFKRRTQLPTPTGADVSAHLLGYAGLSSLTQRFCFDYYRKQLRPVALIDYWRRPFNCGHLISKTATEFRLTLDSELSACQTRRLTPGRTARRRSVLPGYTVMEVKFQQHVPAWFHRLIQLYELQQMSISKICYGLEALNLVEDC